MATSKLFGAAEESNSSSESPPPYRRFGATLYCGDFLRVSAEWPSPTVIIVDGPYGVGSFPGDPVSHEALAEWYRPHVARWAERSLPETTLWFWNTEIGWAGVHRGPARPTHPDGDEPATSRLISSLVSSNGAAEPDTGVNPPSASRSR